MLLMPPSGRAGRSAGWQRAWLPVWLSPPQDDAGVELRARGKNPPMARNRVTVSASPRDVFSFLSNGYSFASWVVGTSQVTSVDPGWPEKGSRFFYRAGAAPLVWEGATEVVDGDPPRQLSMRTMLPSGEALIDIEVRAVKGGTEVTLTESAGPRWLRDPLDAVLHLRNSLSLWRLQACVDGEGIGRSSLQPLLRGGHWLDEPPFDEILRLQSKCFLAVETKSGPHVTPTMFTLASGRIWLVAERSALKSRVIPGASQVGVSIRHGDSALVISGRASLMDPAKPWLHLDLRERLMAAPALARYLLHQGSRLGGYVTAPVSALRDLNPARRVLVCISPERVALVRGATVTDRRGPGGSRVVPDEVASAPAIGERLDLPQVPEDLVSLACRSRVSAVLGWQTGLGPLALPAHWHGDRGWASVPAALLQGVSVSEVALCLEHEEGDQLGDQKGLLVRGRGKVVGSRDEYAAVAIEPDRATFWEGAEAETVDAHS